MTILTSANSNPIAAALHHSRPMERVSVRPPSSDPSTPPPTPCGDTVALDSAICVKPFDRWRPLGGGAERDIFRRFKIQAMEEEDFLLYWIRKRVSVGIFARDESGTLILRISSTEIPSLIDLAIGRSDTMYPAIQWMHVYDEEGVSWLTQSHYVDPNISPKIYDTVGRPIFPNGRIGRYGPSGFTPHDFVTRVLQKGSGSQLSSDQLSSNQI